MNLLEKAKVITTPTAYSDGILHSVKPNVLENLLLQSNQFGTTWTTSNASVTSGHSGYDGSSDAWKLIQNTTNTYHYIRQDVSTTSICTYSIYAKAGEYSGISFFFPNVGGTSTATTFNLSTGTFVNNTHNATSQDVGGGWYRISLLTKPSGAQSFNTYVNQTTQQAEAGDGTSGIYIQDAQLNKGLTADQYIETTTKTSPRADFTFTRNSSATRVGEDGYIQDVQIIGGELVQNGNFEQIGSELVTNGDFSNGTSDWSPNAAATLSIDDGRLKVSVSGAASGYPLQNITTEVGKTYKVTANGFIGTSSRLALYNNADNVFNSLYADGSLDFTFVATSTSTQLRLYVFDDGAYGFWDNVSVKEVGQNWTLTQATVEDGKLLLSTTDGSFSGATQTLGAIGRLYRITLDVADIIGTVSVAIGGGTDVDITTNGTHTVEIISASTTFEIKRKFGVTNVSATIDNISVKEITNDTNLPRINYEGFSYENGLPIYGSGKGHFLLEGQSTNIATNSEYMLDFAKGSASSLQANAATSPDGKNNATYFYCNITTTNAYLIPSFSGTSGVQYAVSFYAKAKELNFVYIKNVNDSGSQSYFDLSNGTFTLLSGIDSMSIEDVGDGWYRCIAVSTSTSTGIKWVPILKGDANEGVYVYGLQIEQASYHSSYIPTNGSAVTRAAETCNNAGNADLFDSSGVLYAEIAALANDGTTRRLTISDGTTINRILIGYTPTLNQIFFFVASGDVAVANTNYTLNNALEFNKIAIRYRDNDFSFWVNGLQIYTDTSGTAPSGLSELAFDNGGGNDNFYGKTKMLGVFPYLSNDEMECLTGEGYGTFQAMALANNYTVI